MIPLVTSLLARYSAFLQPILFLFAWLFSAMFISTIVSSIVDVRKRSATMHQIPCHSCRYSTNNHYLRCTVNPSTAFSESAINCFDFYKNSTCYSNFDET